MLAADAEIAGLVRGSWQDFRDRDRLVAAESAVTQLLAEAQRYYFAPGDDAAQERRDDRCGPARGGGPACRRGARGLARLDANVQQLLGAKPVEEALFDKLTFITAGPRVDSLTARLRARAGRRAHQAGALSRLSRRLSRARC